MKNLDYYQHRLEDLRLLDQVLVLPGGDIAVPVGGRREGGSVHVTSRAEGKRVVARLRHMPELFPNARYMGHTSEYGCPTVEWGPLPDMNDVSWWPYDEIGRYYGYTDEAIAEFVGRMEHHDETGEWLPWSYEAQAA